MMTVRALPEVPTGAGGHDDMTIQKGAKNHHHGYKMPELLSKSAKHDHMMKVLESTHRACARAR